MHYTNMENTHLTPTDEVNLTNVEKEILERLDRIEDALVEKDEKW